MLQSTTRKTMSSWTDVADDLWQVRMPDGSVHAMSIEELDSAFVRGELDLTTRVQHPSGGDWMTVGEAAGMAGDSITPMAVATEIREFPRPAPLPRRPLQSISDDTPLTADELRFVKPRSTGTVLSMLGGAALLLGGIVAWHFMPTNPTPSLTTTTITAPPDMAAAAVIQEPAPESTNPPEVAPPETSPAPEGNAVSDPSIAKVSPPAKPAAKKKPGFTNKKSGKKKH